MVGIVFAATLAAIPPAACCGVFAIDRATSEVTLRGPQGALLKFAAPQSVLDSIKIGDPVHTYDEFRRGTNAHLFFWNGSGVKLQAKLRDVIVRAPFCCTATLDPSGFLTIRDGATTYAAILLAANPPPGVDVRTAGDFEQRCAFLKVKGLTFAADLLPPLLTARASRPFRVVASLESRAPHDMRTPYSDMKRALILQLRQQAREKKADAVTDVSCEAVAHATRFKSPLTCTATAIAWTAAR